MTWLKKIGEIVLRATVIISGLAPSIKAFTNDATDAKIDKAIDKMQEMQAVIIQAEIFGQALGLTGIDKLKAASAAMTQVILTSSILVDRKIDNPALFQAGTTKITDGFADILNSLKSNIDTEDKT